MIYIGHNAGLRIEGKCVNLGGGVSEGIPWNLIS